MGIVAGVDFGTLSVRVTLLDCEHGRLGTTSAAYLLGDVLPELKRIAAQSFLTDIEEMSNEL
jgi:ribulose kinase